ncbi:MAG: zinc metallopeptidase [Myxococcales bacterium]|nr:zinc metallopeptidase [Myxococcales bacterium]
MFIDPLYLVLAAPGMLLAIWAQIKVKGTFARYAGVRTARGMSGAEVAEAILRAQGVRGVRIERVSGWLSDHYDPRHRALRLSPEVYSGRTIAAAGVAAHEVGHALQHAQAYAWLGMRSALVPVLGIASPLAMPILVIGLILSSYGSALGGMIMLLGLGLFGLVVLFQLITLPVEFDASRRALEAIGQAGILSHGELQGARKVLSAAALTYLAAAISALLTLLYFLIRSGLLGGRSRD